MESLDDLNDRLWEEYEDQFRAWLNVEIETTKEILKNLEKILNNMNKLETKEEKGLIYYKTDNEWKLAGRAGKAMTLRYLELLKGKPTCVCGCEKCNTTNKEKSDS